MVTHHKAKMDILQSMITTIIDGEKYKVFHLSIFIGEASEAL